MMAVAILMIMAVVISGETLELGNAKCLLRRNPSVAQLLSHPLTHNSLTLFLAHSPSHPRMFIFTHLPQLVRCRPLLHLESHIDGSPDHCRT